MISYVCLDSPQNFGKNRQGKNAPLPTFSRGPSNSRLNPYFHLQNHHYTHQNGIFTCHTTFIQILEDGQLFWEKLEKNGGQGHIVMAKVKVIFH